MKNKSNEELENNREYSTKEIALARYNILLLWKFRKNQYQEYYWFWLLDKFLKEYSQETAYAPIRAVLGTVTLLHITEWEFLIDNFNDPYVLMPYLTIAFENNNSGRMSKITFARYNLICRFIEFRIINKRKYAESDKEFFRDYNKNISFTDLYEILGNVSEKTLFRWLRQLRKSNTIYCLTPKWGNNKNLLKGKQNDI